jgi:hypothetical protein
MSSATDFYLSALDIDITGKVLTIPGGDNTDVFDPNSYDATAELECPLEFAQHFFQFHTDAVDVNDLNEEDLEFRVFQVTETTAAGEIEDITYYNSKNLLVAEAVVTNQAITYYGSSGTSIDRKKIGPDMSRKISLDLLGTAEGVDIFINEREFCRDLLQKSVEAFVTNIGSISNAKWNDDSADPSANIHPAKLTFKQIVKNFPQRLTPLHPHLYDATNTTIEPGSSTTGLWYYMPFEQDDKLCFRLTVHPNGGQTAIIGDVSAPTLYSRTYLIKLKLVSALTETDEGAYMRPWTPGGPNWTSEPAYLQTTNADTVDDAAPSDP